MGRLVKNIGLALFFLVALLILVNIFVFMPQKHLNPVQVASLSEEAPVEMEQDDTIVMVDTLAVIRKNDIGEGIIYGDPEADVLRNPFYWPVEKFQQKKSVQQAPRQPQLSMVIIGESGKQALLDNAFVHEGDMYHGFLVKRIEEHQVILMDDLGELRIYLTAADDKSGRAQPPGGLIER